MQHNINFSTEEIQLVSHALNEQSFKVREQAINFRSQDLIEQADKLSKLSLFLFSQSQTSQTNIPEIKTIRFGKS
jgi:hypothetical protein